LTPDQCAADFVIRRATRKKYPGACSLEFQNIMKILIEKIFSWDHDAQHSKNLTPLGDINAWIQAIEEQGRGSLHAHWQIFTKQLSSRIREDLFHYDNDRRIEARMELANYIDSIVNASFGTDLKTTHVCNATRLNTSHSSKSKTNITNNTNPCDVEDVFKSVSPQVFRDARHRVLCSHIGGKMLTCKKCKKLLSHEDLFLSTLRQFSRKRRVSTYIITLSLGFFRKNHEFCFIFFLQLRTADGITQSVH
jgi:hypothetical protein